MKKANIEFLEAPRPIREAVTKFGGQPAWLERPMWPLSRATGLPMRFIGQIRLEEDLSGATAARMAYLFMTEDDDEHVDGTWEADGGENAVVLQPGGAPRGVKTDGLATGPTLYRRVEKPTHKELVAEPCEFSVQLTAGEHPTEAQGEEGELDGNKLGGTPGFLQNEEYPGEGEWKLLLQLDSTKVPFYVNFGDAGVGYAFLSADGREARFLWQCC